MLVSDISEIQLGPPHRSGFLYVRGTLGIGDGMKTQRILSDCSTAALCLVIPPVQAIAQTAEGARASKFMELRYGGRYPES